MKKFTSLFALLSCLCVVSAQAEDETTPTLDLRCSSDNWTPQVFTKTGDNEWSLNWDPSHFSGNDVTFNFLADGEWIGFENVQLTSPHSSWITRGGQYNTDFVLHKSITGFITYKISATRDNSAISVTSGWTISIEGDTHYPYTVVGPESVFGSSWNVNDANNDMTVNPSNPSSFILTKQVSGTGNWFEYKVVKGHAWGDEYPQQGNWDFLINNYSPNVIYEVKIIFYPYDQGHECFVTPKSLTIQDNVPFSATGNFTASSATYSRNTGSNQWGTICLPFAFQASDNMALYTIDRVENSVMYFAPISEVSAGQPCIFKLNNPGEFTITGNNVQVVTAPQAPTGNEWQMFGSFTGTSSGEDIYYYISTVNGEESVYYGTNITIPAYRAWFIAPDGFNHAPLRFSTDDTEGLQFVEQEDGTVKAYYDLQGRKLDSARKGLVIENGKIIMKK